MAFGGRVLVLCFVASLRVAVFAEQANAPAPKSDALVHHNSVPGNVHDICAVSPHDVLKHSNTKEYCDRRPFWKDRMVQRGAGHVQDCHLDQATNKIVCAREKKCEGGFSGGYDATATMTNLTYDCESKCGRKGSLIISCCEACLMINANALALVNGYPVNKVVCLGCSNEQLKQAAKNDAACETSGDKYTCESEETCEAGVPMQHTFKDNYTCHIEDCNACQGSQQLKASCCNTCLAKACAAENTAEKECHVDPVTKQIDCHLKIVSAGERYACLGCIPSHPIPTTARPTFAITLFLVLVGIVVAGIIFTPKERVCNWCKTKQYGWHQKRKFAVKSLKRHLAVVPGNRVEPRGFEEAGYVAPVTYAAPARPAYVEPATYVAPQGPPKMFQVEVISLKTSDSLDEAMDPYVKIKYAGNFWNTNKAAIGNFGEGPTGCTWNAMYQIELKPGHDIHFEVKEGWTFDAGSDDFIAKSSGHKPEHEGSPHNLDLHKDHKKIGHLRVLIQVI